MVNIEVNNNKCHLTGNRKVLNALYEFMRVKHPNSWHLRAYMPRGWDGKIDFLTDAGNMNTGLLPMAVDFIKSKDEEISFIDHRNKVEYIGIPEYIGDFETRDYQLEAVKAITENKIDDLDFNRGIIAAATNAGKTLIAGTIFKSYKNVKALILVNNKDLYQQFLDDMPKMFGKDWGYMQGDNIKWSNIMVCMTPTIKSRMAQYQSKLLSYNMILFDECHLVTSKTNKQVLKLVYNSVIRVGLSGTPLLHKDKVKNMNVLSLFGNVVYVIKNKELIDEGFSSPVVVKFVRGNISVKEKGDYKVEYDEGIIRNKQREDMSIERIKFYLNREVYPILVVAKYHEHVERLYKRITKEFPDFKVGYVHHLVRDRKKVIDDFKKGKLDILVASLIIKLGQNMPLIRYMQNAASGDSAINTLQLLGRALRVHKSKTKVYLEDFADAGAYLRRHSKHRLYFYRGEKLKVILLGKEVEKILSHSKL